MTSSEIANIRMANQQISLRKYTSAQKLVGYMGAFQAQDYAMVKWAVGLRLVESSVEMIDSAVDKGEILRTHLMRPTWHFVSSDDIYWMLDLTASKIRSSMGSRNRELGLTEAVFKKSNTVIRTALTGGKHLTREELILQLNKAKIKTDNNRASHLLAEAELSGIICSGKSKGVKQTYALLVDRVHQRKSISKDDALKKLAKKYFMSRGPAALKDFVWWSGQSITNCRNAIEIIEPEMERFEMEGQTYWMYPVNPGSGSGKDKVYLLPNYDEYIISYADRSAVLTSDKHRNIISSNGIFRATILLDGKIIGTWKRTLKNNKAAFELNYFTRPAPDIKSLTEAETERISNFWGWKRLRDKK